MKSKIATVLAGFVLFFVLGCSKYEAPYETEHPPIDMEKLVGYLGKTSDEVRSELSRTLLVMDNTEPAVDHQGEEIAGRSTTVFAYDNARPSWSSDDFMTYLLSDTSNRVNLVLVSRAGTSREGRVYLWELWEEYVAPYLRGGDWHTGVVSVCQNDLDLRHDRKIEASGGAMLKEVEAFMDYQRDSDSFKQLYFSLYAQRESLVLQVLYSMYEYEGHSYYVNRIQIAIE